MFVRILTFLSLLAASSAATAETLRLGVLKFGTVAWELDVIRHHGLDRAEGVDLQVTGLAGKQAAAIAFQGGDVDAIVSDIVWVARQRAAGRMITFAPYSATVGALMVRDGDGIAAPAGVAGRRIGVAGGPLDKSWLLLRALLRRDHGIDPAEAAEPVYGAPPLLRKQFESGGLDALLIFWHYAARLEAAGYRRLADMNDIAGAVAGVRDVALVGYVFAPEFSGSRRAAADAFLRASRAAKRILLADDGEWERIRPLTRAASDAELAELKRRFREGVLRRFGDAEVRDAQRLYAALAGIGGRDLVGPASELDAAAFHPGARF
jgi:NitT/TauT family transport system substrate-binding protein